MELDAQKTVAFKSKDQAQSYYQAGNFGRSFAHFLVALKLMPEWKNELKVEFSETLCMWGEQLESQQRYSDLFSCYEQAIEIFPENEEVLCNLGAHLFRLGHLQEAAHYFRQALEIDADYLPAYRNVQNVCNALVERWHYRMLNDSHRNEAYREAILKKVRQGFTSVLDIGTGTGILSLYAVVSGAKEVHACDYSPTMCAISRQVLKANKMANKVKLINKMSNQLTVPHDFPQRKSLVVTETMDSALLGEHVLQTLLHAWEQLLKPACPQLLRALDAETPLPQHGVVIPFGARLWAAPVQCEDVACRNYLLRPQQNTWVFTNIRMFSDLSEPYDTENLRNIKNCKFLSEPELIFSFDFNNPAQLQSYYQGDNDGKCVSFCYKGKADALAIWFDVLLDEDIVITSSPFSENEQCCWDQAIFRFTKPEESVTVKIKCCGGKLGFDIVPKTPESDDDQHLSRSDTRIKSEIPVGTEVISFINNKELQDALFELPEHFHGVKNVLDLSPFPMLGLRFLQLNGANLCCVLKTVEEVKAVKEFVTENSLDLGKVKCLMKEEFEGFLSSGKDKFDFIFDYIFDKNGELKETSINTIPRLMKALVPEGLFSPVSVTAVCQLVDCEWLRRTSTVVNEDLTQTYRIAEFINVYQVSQQLDVDLKNVSYRSLSEVTTCLELSPADLTPGARRSEQLVVPVVRDGSLSALPLWYRYCLWADHPPLSTHSDHSHVNQVVFIVDPPLHVKCGQSVPVDVTYHSGILRLKIVS